MRISTQSAGVGLIDDVFNFCLLLDLIMGFLRLVFVLETQDIAA